MTNKSLFIYTNYLKQSNHQKKTNKIYVKRDKILQYNLKYYIFTKLKGNILLAEKKETNDFFFLIMIF